MITRIWNFCGDIKVNFWLIFAISVNLAIGSYFISFNPQVFRPLNHSLIQDWFMEYGQYQAGQSWWLVILFALAFFLGMNTFVCAVKRIAQLWPQKKQFSLRAFSVKITPSLIHLCFLVILAGHFLSLIIGYEVNVPVQLNSKVVLPQAISVEVISQHVERYITPVAFNEAVKQCTVFLKIQSPGKTEIKELRVLHPIYWQGVSIHLDVFTKSNFQQTVAPPELKLIIKKDPGVAPVILCFAALCLLMFWYFPQRKKPEEKAVLCEK